MAPAQHILASQGQQLLKHLVDKRVDDGSSNDLIWKDLADLDTIVSKGERTTATLLAKRSGQAAQEDMRDDDSDGSGDDGNEFKEELVEAIDDEEQDGAPAIRAIATGASLKRGGSFASVGLGSASTPPPKAARTHAVAGSPSASSIAGGHARPLRTAPARLPLPIKPAATTKGPQARPPPAQAAPTTASQRKRSTHASIGPNSSTSTRSSEGRSSFVLFAKAATS